jgi:hypothetical protein
MPRSSRSSQGFAEPSQGSAIDWMVAILFVAALFPLVLVDIIPMSDYPNHLARMELLAAAGTPEANPYYDITWKLYPNLAADLLVPELARLMSVEAALRVFFGVSQALIVTGAIAVERQIRGRHLVSGLAADAARSTGRALTGREAVETSDDQDAAGFKGGKRPVQGRPVASRAGLLLGKDSAGPATLRAAT